MIEIKEILDKLNSAYFVLEEQIANLTKTIKEYDLKAKRLVEEKETLNAKTEELNEREKTIKHIESIDIAIKEVQKQRSDIELKEMALIEKEKGYAEKLKNFNEQKTQLDFETDVNKNEGKALRELRTELEKKEKQLRNAEAIIEAKK